MVKCIYLNECLSSKKDFSKCDTCGHNTMRNYIEDHYVKANDNPIPDKCPRLTYIGLTEQTRGYKCPVCGGYTNPYAMRDSLCGNCGYKLNCGT